MRVALVTNLDNKVGLARDCQVLRRRIEAEGHEVTGVHFRKPKPDKRFDLAIFVEIFETVFGDLAPILWMVPNPEWWLGWNEHAGTFHRVLCKTRDAERLFSEMGANTIFTGFEAEDRYDPGIPRERRFLHVAGQSRLKGTEMVLSAWTGLPYPLTVVTARVPRARAQANVTVHRQVSEPALRDLQNRCMYYMAPSRYEGFGHVVHEALSCGALIAATEAPPMTEWPGIATWIRPVSHGQHEIARTADVSAEGIRAAAEVLWAMSDHDIQAGQSAARDFYLAETAYFRDALTSLLREIESRRMTRPLPSRGVDEMPRVTIVLPAHRSAAPLVLRSVLALRWQTAEPGLFEAVIAADGGDPEGDFARVAQAATSTNLPGRPFECRVVESPRPWGEVPHRNHARNAGWRAAKGGLCWMIDSDFLLPPHAVDHLLAEHDAAAARGLPAVLSPCLAGVGVIGPEAWLDKSAKWAETGTWEDYQAAIDCGPLSPAFGGYPERYTGPDTPASSPLGDLPEGMPVIWRGLLEAMQGFDDETFGRWGGDKEELVDRIKGCARAGLLEVRLLSSVMALHQAHPPDPDAIGGNPRPRQRERERRARLIASMATWWRPQLDRARLAMPRAVAEAMPGGFVPPPAPPDPRPQSEDGPEPPEILAVICHHLRQRARRDRAKCAVLGRWSSAVVRELAAVGVDAGEVIGFGDGGTAYGQVVMIDVLGRMADGELSGVASSLAQLCAPKAYIVAIERTKLGAGPRSKTGDVRAPIDYQRALKGLTVACQRVAGPVTYTVMTGRFVQ